MNNSSQAQQPETLVNGFKDSHIVKSFEQICGYDLAKDLSNEYSAQETKEAFCWYKVGIDFASKNIRSRNESLAVQTQQPTADEWSTAQAIADLPLVDEALRGFSEDPTGDNGEMVVREVLRAAQVLQPVNFKKVGWLSWVGDMKKIPDSAEFSDYEPMAYPTRVKVFIQAREQQPNDSGSNQSVMDIEYKNFCKKPNDGWTARDIFYGGYLAAQAQHPTVTDEMIAAAEAVEDLYRRGTPETWKKVFLAMWREMPLAAQAQQESQWISVEDELPAYGQIVDLSINGVLQNETYEIDATDNDLYLTHFWTRDGLDDGLAIKQGQFWRARLPMPKPLPPKGDKE